MRNFNLLLNIVAIVWLSLACFSACSPKIEPTAVVPEVVVPEVVEDTIEVPHAEQPDFQRFPEGVTESVPKRIIPDGQSFDKMRMVPPFWWVGMKNPRFELIIYDRLIKGYRVSTRHKGVTVTGVESVENPNYLFISLEISPDALAGPFKIVLTKGDDVRAYDYELKERKTGEKRIKGLTNADCIYLIMPDRFANGDEDNDSIEGMRQTGVDRKNFVFRHGGDLQGVIDRLDYLKDLGVTALWLNPILENDQAYDSYHGYAVTDHYEVDARFGNNEKYIELVEECHKRDMKVVMDIIHNHVGDQHWMIRDLPTEDWIHQFDSFTKTTYRATTLMDPYVAASDRETMTNGWFDTHMPDLNQKNPHVARYLLQNNIWWTEYSGHNAFRIDTYAYPDPDFTSFWGKSMQEEYPSLTFFGETWVHGLTVQSFFTQNNRMRKGGANTHLPAVTDYQMQYAIMDALSRPQGWTDGITKIYYTLAKDFVYEDPYRNILFLDNHDLNRLFSEVRGDLNRFKSGMALLLTMRGIPCMYYGTEILITGVGGAFGEGGRRDFPGGWSLDSLNKFNPLGRTAQEQEAFEYVRSLLKYRAATPALHRGQLMQFVPMDNIYVYFRYDDQKTVMVMTNSSDQTRMVSTERYRERMGTATKAMNVVSKQQLSRIDSIAIDRNSTLVLELQ
ncbi:MAG: glycoside hydrolase family 13 protein [Bacteroidota bacterium]